jgi:hypothetical protein
MPAASLATNLTIEDRGPDRQFAEHANEPREAPAESRPVAAVEFYSLPNLVDLDPKAVEFDLILPFVAGRHRFGVLKMTGLDELGRTQLKFRYVRVDHHEALFAEHEAIRETQPVDLSFWASGPGAQASDTGGQFLKCRRTLPAEEMQAAIFA